MSWPRLRAASHGIGSRAVLWVAALILFLGSTAWTTVSADQGTADQVTVEPRVIIALVDLPPEEPLRYSRIHQFATMPLEHLGLVVEYHRLSDGLPDLSGRRDVRGVLSWFTSSENEAAAALLQWFETALDLGKKIVFLGEFGVHADPLAGAIPVPRINRFTERLGVRLEGSSINYPGDAAYLRLDRRIWGFEQLPDHPLPFPVQQPVGADTKVHVEVGWAGPGSIRSAVVVTHPNGGSVAPGYTAEYEPGDNIRRWRINPFAFFRKAYAIDGLPAPDTTTLAGRRIFFSHIDGDGWRSVSEVAVDERSASAAEVLYHRVIRPLSHLPVTVGPIAAELDPSIIDDPTARQMATDLLDLDHVEAGSHTYTHPFQWSFFRRYDFARERRITTSLGLSPADEANYEAVGSELAIQTEEPAGTGGEDTLNDRYTIPRAFFERPFSLDEEVAGSMARIAEVGEKPVQVLQWSGDTAPFEAAVAAVREAGIGNINGGDTRLDSDHPSYGFVAPLGRPVGAERQVYAAMSNENTYTDLWTARFFAYRHVLTTIRRTEMPIRVKPINVYYHTYSAERVASLNAVLQVLTEANQQEIAPITTSRYVAIANGFYRAELHRVGDRAWQVRNRGQLATIRFDMASQLAVDMDRSLGVLGERPLHGSLYVALDPADPAPLVVLTDRADAVAPAPTSNPYLLESRWPVSHLRRTETGAVADAIGFGVLSMTWVVPEEGVWRIRASQNGNVVAESRIGVGPKRLIGFFDTANVQAQVPTSIEIDRISD